jgi:hypothetical protein
MTAQSMLEIIHPTSSGRMTYMDMFMLQAAAKTTIGTANTCSVWPGPFLDE